MAHFWHTPHIGTQVLTVMEQPIVLCSNPQSAGFQVISMLQCSQISIPWSQLQEKMDYGKAEESSKGCLSLGQLVALL